MLKTLWLGTKGNIGDLEPGRLWPTLETLHLGTKDNTVDLTTGRLERMLKS